MFSGNESIDYEDLLDSLEEKYELNGLSDYEDPDEVRIGYHISGAGSRWQNIIRVEVDEKQNSQNWIPDLSSIKQRLEGWSGKGQEYMITSETQVHTFHDHDISMREMKEFLDSFQQQ